MLRKRTVETACVLGVCVHVYAQNLVSILLVYLVKHDGFIKQWMKVAETPSAVNNIFLPPSSSPLPHYVPLAALKQRHNCFPPAQ